MSIYCTIFDIGDEHTTKCKRLKRIGKGIYEQDDSKPCTCGNSPIAYQHSGVLPSNKDKRGGVFMLAAIPDHITRDGRDDKPPRGKWYPWLRIDFHAEDTSMVITRQQAEKLRDSLNLWLKRAACASPKKGE